MDLIFQQHPVVTIGGNHFLCPTIIQYEDTPLMEVGQFADASFTTKFDVYHSDGTHIAVVKGTQIYPTAEGAKAAISLRHESHLTACELEGKTIFELRREGAAALKGAAELYAMEGVLIKCNDSETASLLNTKGNFTSTGPKNASGGSATIKMSGCTFNTKIGVFFGKDGTVIVGCNSRA